MSERMVGHEFMPGRFPGTVDPEKVRQAMAERKAESQRQMDIADAFRDQADHYERESLRIRAQYETLRAMLPNDESGGSR